MSTDLQAPPAPTTRETELVAALLAPKGFGDQTLRNPLPGAIELLGGIPAAEALPTEEILAATERVLRDGNPKVPSLQYSRTEGLPPLREWIAAREGVSADRILITNGGFHGISLAIQAVVERGELVAVDNPIFPLFLRGLQLSAGRHAPVRVGPEGLDVDDLRRQLEAGLRPVALYTVPDFHNPSQGVLPTAARQELVQLAEQYEFVIFADNPYRELRFAGEAQSVAEFNNSEHVIHINTFTKTLGPGLRLGWVVVPERFKPAFVKLRSRQDSHSSTFVQAVIGELLTHDAALFDRVLAGANAIYGRREAVLAGALRRELGGELAITDPEGGLFLWPRLTDDSIDAERLAADASAEGLEYQRGGFFHSGPGTDADRHLRLAYGNVADEALDEAAVRLARAFARQRG